jgi:membrane protein involved in colicin uptake
VQTNVETVRKAAASPQASVRQRAAAVLKLLGVGDTAAGSAAPRAAQAAAVGDLMGGMDEPSSAQGPSSGPDLLGKQDLAA